MNNAKKQQSNVKRITGEKDTRFADAADQALDILEKRGISTDRDNVEPSTVVDHEPMVNTVTTVETPRPLHLGKN